MAIMPVYVSSILAQTQLGNVGLQYWQQNPVGFKSSLSQASFTSGTRAIAPTLVKAKPGDILVNLRLNIETNDSSYTHPTKTLEGETVSTSSRSTLRDSEIYCVVGVIRNNTQAPIHRVKVTYRVGNDYVSRYGATGSKFISPNVLQPQASGVFSDDLGKVKLPERSKAHLVSVEWLNMEGTRYSWP